MKVVKLIIIVVLCVLFQGYNVYAKDTIYSINKYSEENLNFIKRGYNKKGKKDGLIVGGNYLEETIENDNGTYQNYQIILAKYNKNGTIAWNYTYGNTKEDNIDCLEYTYNENSEIDGYLICLEKTYDIVNKQIPEGEDISATLLKIDLDGNLLWEKSAGLNEITKIVKITPTWSDDKKIDGYIAIGYKEENNKKKSIIVKYDRDLNIIWNKPCEQQENEDVLYQDIIPIQEENRIIGYSLIKSIKQENVKEKKELLWLNQEGNNETILDDSLEKYQSSYLEKANNGFILYGITSDVKLKKGKKSYYLINYNNQKQINWETVGEDPVNQDKRVALLPSEKGIINDYTLLYENSVDSSKEVIKLDADGTIQKKIKKISNDYYNFENFYIENDTLYFVGQINCPEDDNCEYDKNSLFLVSDEDTVIEVKDDDSKNIIIGIGVIIIMIAIIIYKKGKKKEQAS